MDLKDKKALLKQLGDKWELENSSTQLTRKYKFKNFMESLKFVIKISEIAEALNHHPEISFGWGYCHLVIWTHTAKDVTELDFSLAAKLEDAFINRS